MEMHAPLIEQFARIPNIIALLKEAQQESALLQLLAQAEMYEAQQEASLLALMAQAEIYEAQQESAMLALMAQAELYEAILNLGGDPE